NFSDTVQKGNVIKSSVKKGETISPGDKVILTISKGKKITVPELTNMKMSDVTKWIIENNLKLNYTDKYDNNIKNGHVLEATYKKGDIIEEETIIGITVSKGKLKMPKFKNLSEFKSWAEKYNIKYEIKEEFNSDVPKDEIIKFSVKTGKKINIKEGITVYMSKGKAITVPDFSGKTKDAITKECNSLNITCTFINEYNTGTAEGTCISQNIKFGQEISQGDNIQITIATKKQEEVTKTNASKSTKTNNYNSSQKNNYNNNLNNNETSDEKKCNSITIRILPNYVALNDPDKTCKNIKEKYNNAICKMTESNSGTKGQILNTSSLQGKTITDCENFTVEIKSN
ncbi:MAG: PASTA domain-containing protein, partial [Bacilli bacterium]|nr:PASTA domain-containing protein [Bacilli bacterium]